MPRRKDVIDMVPLSQETKERKFVKALADGASVAQASSAIGVTRQAGHKMTKRPSVIKKWQRALEAQGITDEMLAATYKDALSAEKREQTPEGTIECYPDHRTRIMAADAVMNWSLKLQGGEEDEIERPDDVPDVESMTTVEVLKMISVRMRRS